MSANSGAFGTAPTTVNGTVQGSSAVEQLAAAQVGEGPAQEPIDLAQMSAQTVQPAQQLPVPQTAMPQIAPADSQNVASAPLPAPSPLAPQQAGNAASQPTLAQTGNALQPDEAAALASLAERIPQTAPKQNNFLASFFKGKPAQSAPASSTKTALAPTQTPPRATQFLENPAPTQVIENAAPVAKKSSREVQLAALDPQAGQSSSRSASAFMDDGEGSGLPGVRQSALFDIKRRSGVDDDSDVDVYEDVDGGVDVASAAGMARLAPNGLLRQHESVDVACLKPSLIRMLRMSESHFGKRAIITSGYRSPKHNRKVRGARNSQHMYCAAADVLMPGVSKFEFASYIRSLRGRGGVGTYCHTNAVHIDVGPERDWNWRCGRRK